MGVATGCGCMEVYRFLILLIPTPLVSVLFCSSISTFFSFLKCFSFFTLIRLEISCRTRWWCLKSVIVYLARDILAFVMYCVNGESGSSLLIESTNSMIRVYRLYDYRYI